DRRPLVAGPEGGGGGLRSTHGSAARAGLRRVEVRVLRHPRGGDGDRRRPGGGGVHGARPEPEAVPPGPRRAPVPGGLPDDQGGVATLSHGIGSASLATRCSVSVRGWFGGSVAA